MTVPELNPRQELIALMRGQVACPLLSCLGELGWLDRMCVGAFGRSSFSDAVDEDAFSAVMGYLSALGLIETQGAHYAATAVGLTVFARYGAFSLLNSYEEYFRSFRTLLLPDGSPRPAVNRLRNVFGSGRIHARKFFPAALALTGGTAFGTVADMGCGDGSFLELLLAQQTSADAVAVDLSADAVAAAADRLGARFPGRRVRPLVADGAAVRAWAQQLAGEKQPLLVTMWFLVHEISGGKAETVIGFLDQVRQALPGAELMVGEIVRHPPGLLAPVHAESIMPEFTLFHDLSGQGLLTAEAWREVEARMPYRVVARREFDPVACAGGARPSSFVWHMLPR